jgi:hypothetical protein
LCVLGGGGAAGARSVGVQASAAQCGASPRPTPPSPHTHPAAPTLSRAALTVVRNPGLAHGGDHAPAHWPLRVVPNGVPTAGVKAALGAPVVPRKPQPHPLLPPPPGSQRGMGGPTPRGGGGAALGRKKGAGRGCPPALGGRACVSGVCAVAPGATGFPRAMREQCSFYVLCRTRQLAVWRLP